ncbi:MAG: L,D-transpeptidase family protein [Gammaproteobacteria bacterium]|jgi:L,D-transpeptidase ErfK/SrfK|nr:peptigoglycan-binding protein LysM [Chromatiales bacterium]MDP6675064.1 L,D-transpeptidase family protein [Gammaproteobacteria bacterium]
MKAIHNFIVISMCCALVLTACSDYQISVFEDDSEVYDTTELVAQELIPIGGNRFAFTEQQDVVGQVQIVRARYEDTFVDFARAYGLGYDDLVAANPDVDPWLPGEGTLIVLPTQFVLPLSPREGLVLNIAAKRLFYYPPVADGESRVVETFPIGIGRAGWATPTGITTVVSRARDPIWYVPRSVRDEYEAAGDPLPRRVPPGPDNPLGHYVLGLGIPGYLIHGTNKPAGVGMRVSYGCVRLYPEDIEYIFSQVQIGTQVRIVNQPYLFGWYGTDLYFEAHTPFDEDDRDWLNLLLPMARSNLVEPVAGSEQRIEVSRLKSIAGEHRGYPVPVVQHGNGLDAYNVRRVINILASGDSENDLGGVVSVSDAIAN